MKIKTLAVVLGMAATAWAADSVPLTFNAVLTVGKEHRFGVSSPGGAHSAWLGLGGEFEGYKLEAFDDKTQVLTLTHEGQTLHVSLASGSIQTLTTKATIEDAAEVMNKMKFEQMMGRMIEQQKKSLAGMSKQMLGQMAGKVSAEDFTAYQSKVMDALWAEMKPEDLKNEMVKIYAELFTKDELRGMSDFYSTPAGQAMIDKQPEMQMKLLEVMSPRMAKAMPKIQQLAQEFAQQQKAKAAAAATPPAPAPATPAKP